MDATSPGTRATTPLSGVRVVAQDMSEGANATDRLENIPWYTVPGILLGVPLLFWLITLVAPGFYDQVIWQYYWGPIKADAAGRSLVHNGVTASPGYNLVNTISWAVLMGVSLVGITQILNGLKVKMNNTVIVGATLWVVSGAVWHVLEDTDLIVPPLQYFFITPPIYLLFGAFGILAILTGVYMEQIHAVAGKQRALQKLWMLQSIGVLLYTLAWATDWSQVIRYVHPVHVALIVALNFFVIRWWTMRSDGLDGRTLVVLLNIAPLLLALDYIALFLSEPWRTSGAGLPSAVITAPLLAAGLTGIVWATAQAGRTRNKQDYRFIGAFALLLVVVLAWATQTAPSVVGILGFFALAVALTGIGILVARTGKSEEGHGNFLPYLLPVNLLLVFSQLVDGFATSLGLDMAGYTEKHVLSAFLIDAFRDFSLSIGWTFGATYPTFLAFVPVKLGVSLLVVWAIDIYSKEDVAKYPTFIGFVKFAIIMVGIGPGVRDFVRLAMGV